MTCHVLSLHCMTCPSIYHNLTCTLTWHVLHMTWHDVYFSWHGVTFTCQGMTSKLVFVFFGIHDYFFVCLETQYTCNILIQNCFLFSRQLCLLLNAEDIYRAMSEILLQEEDFQFASLMVRYLNMILLTSSELFDLRDQLRELATAVRKLQLILFQLVSSCSRVMFL